jgi:uncharacterized protein (DUF58 family)
MSAAVREAISASVARIGAPAFWRVYRIDRLLRRKLTAAGWFAAALLTAAAVFGLNTKDSLIYQLFGLAFGLLLVAAVASWRLGLRASVSRALPHVATAGVPFDYWLTVKNLGDRGFDALRVEEVFATERPSNGEFVSFKVREDRTRNLFDRMVGYPRWVSLMRTKVGARAEAAEMPLLAAGASQALRMRCLPLRRGELRFDAVSIGRAEPLGLMKALRLHRLRETLLVMPKTHAVAPLQLPGSRRLQPGGVAFAGHIGDAEEFVSLRDYRSGDTPRRIHWKAWARTGKLVIKEYQDEFFVRHALLLDTFPAGDTAAFEAAVSVAASLVMMPRSNESLLDLMFVEKHAYTVTQGRGLGATTDLLRVLATVQPSRGRFEDLAEAALLNAARISGGIVVLLDWDEPRRKLVASLRGLGIPLRVWVVRDEGGDAPLDPGPMASDARNFRVVNTANLAQELLRP